MLNAMNDTSTRKPLQLPFDKVSDRLKRARMQQEITYAIVNKVRHPDRTLIAFNVFITTHYTTNNFSVTIKKPCVLTVPDNNYEFTSIMELSYFSAKVNDFLVKGHGKNTTDTVIENIIKSDKRLKKKLCTGEITLEQASEILIAEVEMTDS